MEYYYYMDQVSDIKYFDLVNLETFPVFSEYLIGISILYLTITISLVFYKVYGLIIQKAISESIAVILFMACFLIMNDDAIKFHIHVSFHHSIMNDWLAYYTKFIVCFFSAIYFLIIKDSLKEQKISSPEYLLIILFAVLGLILMCSSHDLLTTYLTIELTSLASYIIAAYKKNSSYSVESGIKYFITGIIASAFFLYGSTIIYGIYGSIYFDELLSLLKRSDKLFNSMMWYKPRGFYDYMHIFQFLEDYVYSIVLMYKTHNEWFSTFNAYSGELGLALILLGIFIKLGLAPFHLWSLDVYEGSPTPSTTFFAVLTKLSSFVILIRICYYCFFEILSCWQFYSLWIGLFSIFVGSFGGLKQRKLKTLLAYSSINHMGYALLALSTALLQGIQVILFYIIIYMISNIAIWHVILLLRMKTIYKNKYSKELADLSLLKNSNVGLAFSMSLNMFSVAGIPPLIGFLAKLVIFLPLMVSYSYLPAIAGIICSVVSTFYYIRINKVMFFENVLVGRLFYSPNSYSTIILSFLTIALIFLFLSPNLFYLLTDKITVIFAIFTR